MFSISWFRPFATALVALAGVLLSASVALGSRDAGMPAQGITRLAGEAAPIFGATVQSDMPLDFRHDTLSRSRATAAIQIPGTWGTVVTTSTGEQIQMLASPYYRVDYQWLQDWANWMATYLFHSQEFSRLTVLFVVPFELPTICGAGAGGCYSASAGLMVAPGNNLADGTNMATIVSHEYGHHVAANASNPPWDAVTWGPKRWSSSASICTRVDGGTAFPGDEGSHYRLNPAEAFAETYRLAVYNSRQWTNGWWNPAPWNVVDSSFYPSVGSLSAATEDALHPWVAPSTPQTSLRGRFTKTRHKAVTQLWTPFDGDLTVTLYQPIGGRVTLVDAGSGAVLASGTSSFMFRICGERSLRLEVSGRQTQRFRVDATTP